MTAPQGHGSSSGGWKYRVGLLLILAVVLIWVGSAEVTQLIFEKYRHPFLLTWLGASLLSFYLPFAYLRESLTSWCTRRTSTTPRGGSSASSGRPLTREKAHPSTENLHNSGSHEKPLAGKAAAKEVEMVVAHHPGKAGQSSSTVRAIAKAVNSPRADADEEEGAPLLSGGGRGEEVDTFRVPGEQQLSSKEVIYVAMLLAPVWLLTEYLSNAALSMTSVSSTTILSSTSGLFTLLFGVTLGADNLTFAKVAAALVSIAGVVMTELGKSSAADDGEVFGDAARNPGESAGQYALPGHNLAGDICGLLSAVSYGFYTTLLRKWVGGEGAHGEEKADLQKVFGYIGLWTCLGLWWLVFPLYLIGWEPAPTLPSSYGLDEDILANGLVGSMISDYFWAVSVVWTTPLVATLGLSLTIPLAMVADMVVHGRDYSGVYIFGAFGVFAGFIVANLGDEAAVAAVTDTWWFQRLSACLPGWMRRASPPAVQPGIDVDGDVVFSDKEFD